jgi:Ca2+-binding RTX toxin-like protein
MALTAAEQFLIELINRARLDPLAEAARQGRDLNADVPTDERITATAKQVLAPNEFLHDAAAGHSQWMLDNNVFQHSGENGSSPGQRMAAAGYDFISPWVWSENIALQVSTNPINLNAAIVSHFDGLFQSAGHRLNTLDEQVREIGVGQVAGLFTDDGSFFNSPGATFNASMLTENFAAKGATRFVTGVAFDDTDDDGFYSIGEGRAGATFTVDSAQDTTDAVGGYAVGSTSTGVLEVSIETDQVLGIVETSLTDGNVKIDVVNGTDLLTSGDLTLITGFTSARLLGGADLDLTGADTADTLIGNSGDNRILGGLGADTLEGGDGADTLNGGDGDDSIIGGATEADRRDVVFAGAGNDFVDSGFGNDELNGMEGDDALQGWFGSDTVIGGLGNDVVNGGPGSDLIFGGPGSDFVNGGFGHDRINGGTGADRFFHLGIFDHGSDWVQDFTHTEGDVLIFGQAGATADQFHVNTASIAGDAAVEEAFVVFRPTGQIIWALVDGMENASINLRIAGSGDVFDLLG